jgi:hypothetical protein
VVLIVALSATTYGVFRFFSDGALAETAKADGIPLPTTAPSQGRSAENSKNAAGDSSLAPIAQALPVGDLPGWKQIFTEDFTSGDVPIGGFPGPLYAAKWSSNYIDGTPDTAGQIYKSKSGYYPSKVLSIHDGVLDMYLHSEKGVSMGAAPAPKVVENQPRPFNGQLYGRYSVRFKAEAPSGFKTAWLLWPDSGKWPLDGEIDFPEGDLSGNFFAAMHGAEPSGSVIDVFETGSSYSAWHIATTEWSPGRVEFFLDGRSVGVSKTAIPNKSMHYLLQTESCLPTCPLTGVSGHVYIDWVAIWARS